MIRFGTRGSQLALTQTRWVAEELQRRTGEDYTIDVIQTRGDKDLTTPLPQIGVKGLFTRELEDALHEGRIDAAVHSLKDLPVEDPAGLVTAAIPERAAVQDVLVFDPEVRDPEGGTIPLLGGCVVGTSSPRRSSSLLALRRDLVVKDIRGNVETRARKVADGDYDATVLAAAGLSRLGLQTPELERVDLSVELFTPAPGQGALGIQCRADDARSCELLSAIDDPKSAKCTRAERKVLFLLGGGCSMPLGVLVCAHAKSGYRMLVSLFSERRPECGIRLELFGADAEDLAKEAAEQLEPLLQDPLAGHKIVLLRPGGAGGRLENALCLAGADVETVPVSEVLPLPDAARGLTAEQLQTIAFTSARAVDRFFEEAAVYRLDLSRATFFGVGHATSDALRRRGHDCDVPDNAAGGAELAEWIATRVPRECPVLFPCALERHSDFEMTLTAAGFRVDAMPVYRTVTLDGVEVPAADHVVITSPSAMHAIADRVPEKTPTNYLALGHTTASAMRDAGLEPAAVSEAPTARALVSLIRGLPHDHSTETTAPHAGDS